MTNEDLKLLSTGNYVNIHCYIAAREADLWSMELEKKVLGFTSKRREHQVLHTILGSRVIETLWVKMFTAKSDGLRSYMMEREN